ncbi:hypothetical protein NKH18_46580 [Streptomyces sp. M10(2022)]
MGGDVRVQQGQWRHDGRLPLLERPLKTGWGFDGLVVSDWGAVRTLLDTARSAQDLAMPGPAGPWASGLLAAVEQGLVDRELLDDKVRRLLRLAGRVGALGGEQPSRRPAASPPTGLVCCAGPSAQLRSCCAMRAVCCHWIRRSCAASRSSGRTPPRCAFRAVAARRCFRPAS